MFASGALLVAACHNPIATAAADQSDRAAYDASGPQAYSHLLPALSAAELERFAAGQAEFSARWVVFPGSGGHWGLGPQSNAAACAECHVRNGRGRAPDHVREQPVSMVVRLSVPGANPAGGPRPHPAYGEQLSTRGVLGRLLEEGNFAVHYRTRNVRFADGETVELRQPQVHFTALWYGPLGKETMISPRIALPVFGAGLLEAVPESQIRAIAARQARLGFNGRPNRVRDRVQGVATLGRFGHKAAQPSLYQQIASAFIMDMGVNSRLFPDEKCWPAQHACYGIETVSGLEAQDRQLDAIEFYLRALSAPARRNVDDRAVRRGERLFAQAQCAVCHVPELTTSAHAAIPALRGKTIRPYTDLLLHDMGEGLADGRPEFLAGPRDWRTTPLWGLGLSESVNGNANLLHDGRARTITEAILWHGGEAEVSRDAFLDMPKPDREALLAFLESL
ncbi:MAG TPA: di-heme oxidoredictase family protein [Burkholderiales bacterium]|nr:di-heme oxidoredictase family protein [Burkholderiales bacterium]